MKRYLIYITTIIPDPVIGKLIRILKKVLKERKVSRKLTEKIIKICIIKRMLDE